MKIQKDNRRISGRRNFILTALTSPFLLSNLIAHNIFWGNPLQTPNEKENFVILGRWVFIKEDLTKNQG